MIGLPATDRRPQGQFDAARFDTLTANALRLLLDDAAAKGLPTAPLINRALEGAARRVGGQRILSVVRAHAAALAEAKLALGEGSAVVFVQRPVSLVLILVVIAVLVLPRLVKRWSARVKLA